MSAVRESAKLMVYNKKEERQNWRKRVGRKVSSRMNILKMAGMTEMLQMVKPLTQYIEKHYLDMKQVTKKRTIEAFMGKFGRGQVAVSAEIVDHCYCNHVWLTLSPYP